MGLLNIFFFAEICPVVFSWSTNIISWDSEHLSGIGESLLFQVPQIHFIFRGTLKTLGKLDEMSVKEYIWEKEKKKENSKPQASTEINF